MQLVTDTHPLIHFFVGDGRKLSKKVRAAFEDATCGRGTLIFVPAPVLWELSMLVENNAIKLDRPFSAWSAALFDYPLINFAPLDFETVKTVHNLRFHTDPFDRAIVATALVLGLPLISNDGVMHDKKPCELYWD